MVDLDYLARCLDIVEIKYEPLRNIEGALITTSSRSIGSILVNNKSRKERRRFTLAHELGHFLNPWHKEPTKEGFWCIKGDISSSMMNVRRQMTIFDKQEIEANRFASELLMPSRQIKRSLERDVCLDEVFYLARTYGVSKEAMARRYVELRPEDIAIIFSKDGIIRYPVKGKDMPKLSIKEGHSLPHLSKSPFVQNIHAFAEVDPAAWFSSLSDRSLCCEHFPQKDGYAMTLLQFDE